MKALAALAVGVLAAATAAADYPRILRPDQRDPVFRQLQEDIAAYHRAEALRAAGKPVELPALVVFSYTRSTEDLFSLAARLGLPYDTIATANGLANPADLEGRATVLVPNMPGLFVPQAPRGDFEEILASSSANRTPGLEVVLAAGEGERRLRFFPGARFNPVERAFFLRILFHFPLQGRAKLTSTYGIRASPFGGHPQFHNGIDIAAPEGTPVLAARDGLVEEVGRDPVLGVFVRIEHQNGYETVYGHLRETAATLNQAVHSGMIIGKVGTTGLSTGPHLHFEVRRKGASRDPLPLIRIDQR